MKSRDDNFEELMANWDLFNERIVIFLGAGASIGARNTAGEPLLNAYELRNALWNKFKYKDPSVPFDPADLKLMSLEHAGAIIESQTGRRAISDYLVTLFKCDRPLWQHVVLPYLKPRCLFTTNYDELVELGYKNQTDLVDVICNSRKPMPNSVVLYKPHGSLTHANQPVGKGGLVITQFDYFEMITDYREMLRQAMIGFDGRCVLCVGYSFGDMDIGSELCRLRRQKDVPWYAIFPRDDPQVRKMYSTRLGIEQINRTFEEFLKELDERVELIPEKFKHKNVGELRLSNIIQ